VAKGRGTGPKEETTIATRGGGVKELLGREWLQRWQRSQAKYPYGLDSDDERGFDALILKHAQFSLSTESLPLEVAPE